MEKILIEAYDCPFYWAKQIRLTIFFSLYGHIVVEGLDLACKLNDILPVYNKVLVS